MTDQYGRKIYFVPGDDDLFGKYILPYILRNHPGELAPFLEAPLLWRSLRREADFYRVEGLCALLQVTHSCSENDPNGRGVLYYLGTNKGTSEYKNSHSIEAVRVFGWPDMTTQGLEAQAGGAQYCSMVGHFSARTERSRKSLCSLIPTKIFRLSG